jgi:hypothetical protein
VVLRDPPDSLLFPLCSSLAGHEYGGGKDCVFAEQPRPGWA